MATQKQRQAAMAASRKWSHQVRTVSTYPPEGLFTKDAQTIAQAMASQRVSPKGIGSGIRMVQFFINRAGRSLSAHRRQELEQAKKILQSQSSRPRPAGSKSKARSVARPRRA
jgi:hypothetical protein